MSLQQLLAINRIRPHATSRQEIEGLRGVIDRDLKDAALPGLSADRRFATAYNAALQLAKIALACEGYRIAFGTRHHQTAFEAVPLILGPGSRNLADYFETCRRKRHALDYDVADITSDTEAEELLQKAQEFRLLVEGWVKQHHPHHAP